MIELVADVYMYLMDTLLRYGVTADDIGAAFVDTHNRNISRNFSVEYDSYLK